jgi:hypothetical protein
MLYEIQIGFQIITPRESGVSGLGYFFDERLWTIPEFHEVFAYLFSPYLDTSSPFEASVGSSWLS